MDMWEKAKMFQKTTVDRNGKYSYGEDAFRQYLEGAQLFFGEWKEDLSLERVPFVHLKGSDRHKKYKEKGYAFSEEKYLQDSELVLKVLQKFNYEIFLIRNHPLFHLMDFPHLAILIKDIYLNGAMNWPCFRIHPEKMLCVHPGNHLWFVRRFLFLEDKGFVSCRKNRKSESKFLEDNFEVEKEVLSGQQIQDFYGGREVLAKIQNYGFQKIPSFEAKTRKGSWSQYDNNGHARWPEEGINSFYNKFNQLDWLELYDEICRCKEGVTKLIEQHFILNREFSCEEELKNYLFAFLMTGEKTDKNFTIKKS